MPQISPKEAGQELALALEDAAGDSVHSSAAEQRRAIYVLCASCSDVEAGELVRAIATTLYSAGVREAVDEEVRVRLREPEPRAPTSARSPEVVLNDPANDSRASSHPSTLPPPPPGVA